MNILREDLFPCPVCGRFPLQELRTDQNCWTGSLHQDILVCRHEIGAKEGMLHSDLYVYATASKGPHNEDATKEAKKHSLEVAEHLWQDLCGLSKAVAEEKICP